MTPAHVQLAWCLSRHSTPAQLGSTLAGARRGGGGVVVSLHLPPIPSPSPVLGYSLFVSHSVDKHLNVILTTQTVKSWRLEQFLLFPHCVPRQQAGVPKRWGSMWALSQTRNFFPGSLQPPRPRRHFISEIIIAVKISDGGGRGAGEKIAD